MPDLVTPLVLKSTIPVLIKKTVVIILTVDPLYLRYITYA